MEVKSRHIYNYAIVNKAGFVGSSSKRRVATLFGLRKIKIANRKLRGGFASPAGTSFEVAAEVHRMASDNMAKHTGS